MEICAKDLRPPVPTEKAAWFSASSKDFGMYCDLMKECWRRGPADRPPCAPPHHHATCASLESAGCGAVLRRFRSGSARSILG